MNMAEELLNDRPSGGRGEAGGDKSDEPEHVVRRPLS